MIRKFGGMFSKNTLQFCTKLSWGVACELFVSKRQIFKDIFLLNCMEVERISVGT